jgi:hypothetical protein
MTPLIPISTLINYLDDHAGAFTALLTAILITVTAYYAAQNRRMVKELAATRELMVLPKLALEFLRLGPTATDVLVRNVGPGPALDVDVRLIFEPRPEGNVGREERRWRRNLLAPGEQKDFLPPGDLNDNLNRLPKEYQEVRLVGSMRDATGKTYVVDEVFSDLAAWREMLGRERFVGLPERELAEAFAKKFDGSLKALNQSITGVAGALHHLRESPGGAEEDLD